MVHPAGARLGARQVRLDRDVQLGRRPALAHLVDMDGARRRSRILARAAHVHDLGQDAGGRRRSGTLSVIGPRPRI